MRVSFGEWSVQVEIRYDARNLAQPWVAFVVAASVEAPDAALGMECRASGPVRALDDLLVRVALLVPLVRR